MLVLTALRVAVIVGTDQDTDISVRESGMFAVISTSVALQLLPADSSDESWEEEEEAANLTAPRPKEPAAVRKLGDPLKKRNLLKKLYPEGDSASIFRLPSCLIALLIELYLLQWICGRRSSTLMQDVNLDIGNGIWQLILAW